MTLDFAYTLYLMLSNSKEIEKQKLKNWFRSGLFYLR